MNAHNKILSRAILAFCVFILIVFSSSVAAAQLMNARFVSSVYGWKQYDTVGTAKKFWRGYQSVLLDVAQDNFSLHGHFQGAVMLQKKLDELPDYRLYYGYAQWKNIVDVVDLSFGRVPFFAGVGSGTIDGALTRFRVADNKLRMTFYGGANVPADLSVKTWGPLKKDFTLGGQILLSVEDLRFGVSYLNRQRQRPGYWTMRPDSLFTLAALYVDPDQTKEQFASGDFSYWLPNASFHARYDYNVDYMKTQRGQFGVRYYPSERWGVSAEYIHRAPRLPFNSFFAVFDLPSSDELEGGVDYTLKSATRFFVRGAFVQYLDDHSVRYTLGVANNHASVSYLGSTGYSGELSAVALQGSYPLLDRMLIPTLGIS
ncbi:MAG: hypothetical protein HW412_2111, partial [Bacteroidetes bacterium]|nr:hypothetical protein [Bacteroidota bacterium]